MPGSAAEASRKPEYWGKGGDAVPGQEPDAVFGGAETEIVLLRVDARAAAGAERGRLPRRGGIEKTQCDGEEREAAHRARARDAHGGSDKCDA